jgi:hypothetical protein
MISSACFRPSRINSDARISSDASDASINYMLRKFTMLE